MSPVLSNPAPAPAELPTPEVSPERIREAAWIREARTGNCAAFDELCLLHGDRLLGQAIKLCPDVALAEDLVQETLIAGWRSLHRYNGGCQFFTWLCSILIHRHHSMVRRRWWREILKLDSSLAAETPDSNHNPEEASLPEQALTGAESTRLVHECIQRLPRKQREVVQLRFFADESLAGIAAATNSSVGTVKSRLFHGLERLRQMKKLRKEKLP